MCTGVYISVSYATYSRGKLLAAGFTAWEPTNRTASTGQAHVMPSPTIFHSFTYCVLPDIAQASHEMKAHIHTLKAALTEMLSRYKRSFSANRQQTDNEKDRTICHNAKVTRLYSLGPSLKISPHYTVYPYRFPLTFFIPARQM
jgi:hypothetical protein